MDVNKMENSMKRVKRLLVLALLIMILAPDAWATQRLFTYTYEPETMPQGALEFEEWTTLRAVRNNKVGKNHYTRWDLRQELEYGVTDDYTLSVYLNEKSEYFRNPTTFAKTDTFKFDGISIENKWTVLNPVNHPIGLSLYLEPRFANGEIELEEKIILGQRSGNWKWAFNVSHATEWEDSDEAGKGTETTGELEFDFGASYELNKHWSAGVEFRNHNDFPEYESQLHTAFFVGPVVTYRQEKWWATLTFLTQFYGDNRVSPDPDGNNNLVLDKHELFNARLIVGIDF